MRTMFLVAVLTFTAAAHAQSTKPDVGAGKVSWFDITTKSMAKSEDFYTKLFDWTFKPVTGTDLAVTIVSGGTEIGSLRVAEGAISAYDGVVYIQVNDIMASCKKATSLGAKIPPGFPFDLPGGKGSIAVLTDPAGHPIGMYSHKPML